MMKQVSRGEGPIGGIFKSVLKELFKFHNTLIEVWQVTFKNSQ